MRIIENRYFKDYGDDREYISGLQIPKDEDGICRDVHFIGCDFHPGCAVPYVNCVFERCIGSPNSWNEFVHAAMTVAKES